MKLTRNLFVPLVDTSDTTTPAYKPIDLSTIFELSFNPQEETYSYICYANDSTEVTSYAPELPQEIVLDNSNPIYLWAKAKMFSFPTGSECQVPVLLAMPNDTTAEVTDGILWSQAVLSPGTLNTVDGKLTFTLKLNGDPTKGTVAGIGTDTIRFTPVA